MSGGSIIGSTFSGSNLPSSQFRYSVIKDTFFTNANLYRAAFDGAKLCNVDFGGAFMREATVYNTVFDDKTAEALAKTDWWLAKGWTYNQAMALIDKTTRLDIVRNSAGFKSERSRAESAVRVARRTRDDRALANALNDLSWTLASHGVDVPSTSQQRVAFDGQCDYGGGILQNAEDAANEALCLIRRASVDMGVAQIDNVDNGKTNGSAEWTEILNNVEDTLGYVLLQAHKKELAIAHLKEGPSPNDKSRNGPATLFRLRGR